MRLSFVTPSTSCGHVGAEVGAKLLEVRLGVLDHVVQEGGRDRLLVEVELCADPRDAEWVVDELLARTPGLAGVCPLCELERAPQELLVDVRVVGLDLGDQLLDQVFAMPFCVEDTHEISVLSGGFGTPPSGEERATCPRTA